MSHCRRYKAMQHRIKHKANLDLLAEYMYCLSCAKDLVRKNSLGVLMILYNVSSID